METPRKSTIRATVLSLFLGVTVAVPLSAEPAQALPAGAPVAVATVPHTPWEIAVRPAGGAFVVERDGDIVFLDAQDKLSATPALARTAIPSVRKLLGLALAPDFAATGLAYLYVSQGVDPDGSGPANGTNSIWRLRASGATLAVVDQVFGGIDSDGNHDGGRMVFGPDGGLYVTTGDIHQPSRPQSLTSLNGKILRLAVPASGPLTAPVDNPYVAQGGSAAYVWSLGHRHPQGLAFDAAGRLWETEHGPTGEMHGPDYPGGNNQTGRDELNLIVRGGNYGWPLVSGPDNRPGLIAPAAVAADAPAWAPGDLAVGADGSLYAPFLAGERLHRFDVRRGVVVAQGDHVTDQGRLRVAVADGTDLLVVQDDADGAAIFRIPLSAPTPGGSDAADPLSATSPTTPATTGPPVTAASTRHAIRELARTTAKALRRAGRAAVLAGRPVRVSSGMPAGVTTLTVRLRGPRGPVLFRERLTGRPAGALAIAVRLDRGARARLRGSASGVLAVTVRHRTPGSSAHEVATRLRLGPRTT